MNFNLENWTDDDIASYQDYMISLKGDDYNCEWERRIVNTKLLCLARTSTKAREVANKIAKGNYLSFIEKFPFKTHADTIVLAFLICKIKDFAVFKEHLTKFAKNIDNWASCDALRFKNRPKEKLWEVSQDFIKSDKPFVRRIGVNILFEFVDSEGVEKIFETLNKLKDETEYYVNMSGAWLLCECFIKQREATISYFKSNTTNNFIINKAISKCRDSFRVTSEDKKLLLDFKRKN